MICWNQYHMPGAIEMVSHVNVIATPAAIRDVSGFLLWQLPE
jgi:hypothetical protein